MACTWLEPMVRSTPRRIGLGPSLVSTCKSRFLISRVLTSFSLTYLIGSGFQQPVDFKFCFDGTHQAFFHLGHGNFGHDFIEEAQHHQAASLNLGNTASAQVEQLLVVETAGGAGVTSTFNLAVF